MNLIEADGKLLLRRFGLRIPPGVVLADPDADGPIVAPPGADRIAVKAQVLAGGRGKAGLVRVVPRDDVARSAREIGGRLRAEHKPSLVLLEHAVCVEREFYVSWRLDDVAQAAVLLFSATGGVDIEAADGPLLSLVADPLRGVFPHDVVPLLVSAGIAGAVVARLARLACELFRAFDELDAELLEINPLALSSSGELVLLDAKIILDDNAAHRHPEWAELSSAALSREAATPLERRATQARLTFIELDGDVAVLSAGAGLGMALIDLLAESGYRAADFVDASGASGPGALETMTDLVLERAARSDVIAIVLFFALSATDLGVVLDGILRTLARRPPAVPVVAGLVAGGTAVRNLSASDALGVLRARGLTVIAGLSELPAALRAVTSSPASTGT